jgi:hypothetical protein
MEIDRASKTGIVGLFRSVRVAFASAKRLRQRDSTQPTGIDFATIPLELNSHNDSELVKIEWIHSGLDKLVDVLNLFFVTMYLPP